MKKNNIIIISLLIVLTVGIVGFNYTNQLVALFVEGATPNPGHSLSEIEGGADLATKTDVANAVSWTVSGTNIYRSSGNVGIGTASPSQKLDVSGNAQIRGHIYDASGNLIYDNSTKKIPRERLPFNQSDIISTAGGSYNVANLYPGNVRSGIIYGNNQTGSYVATPNISCTQYTWTGNCWNAGGSSRACPAGTIMTGPITSSSNSCYQSWNGCNGTWASNGAVFGACILKSGECDDASCYRIYVNYGSNVYTGKNFTVTYYCCSVQ